MNNKVKKGLLELLWFKALLSLIPGITSTTIAYYIIKLVLEPRMEMSNSEEVEGVILDGAVGGMVVLFGAGGVFLSLIIFIFVLFFHFRSNNKNTKEVIENK